MNGKLWLLLAFFVLSCGKEKTTEKVIHEKSTEEPQESQEDLPKREKGSEPTETPEEQEKPTPEASEPPPITTETIPPDFEVPELEETIEESPISTIWGMRCHLEVDLCDDRGRLRQFDVYYKAEKFTDDSLRLEICHGWGVTLENCPSVDHKEVSLTDPGDPNFEKFLISHQGIEARRISRSEALITIHYERSIFHMEDCVSWDE